MSKLKEKSRLRADLIIGKDKYSLYGKIFLSHLHEPLTEALEDTDFLIMPHDTSLMVLSLNRVFGLGDGLVEEEVVLPGDEGWSPETEL